MKFERIVMKHFMRYKGKNTIEFSCDDRKNVTVILGDNTVGKTTIAQAFRWCLYGAVMTEKDKRQEDYALLNNEVLAAMDADSRARMSVELTAADGEKRYIIRREIEYTRAFPKLTARESIKKVSVKTIDLEYPEHIIETEEERKVQELINELFPKNLSHYFLFDGERWNDVSINGVKENIKESVHILTGLSAYRAAMLHLKEMGSNSVIRKFKSKISGSGSIYDNLEADYKRMEKKIENCREQMKTIEINVENCQRKIAEVDRYLEENKNTETMQMRYRQLGVVKNSQSQQMLAYYRSLVNQFSEKGYMMFSRPMIDAALEMVKNVAGERRDIPHMHQATIDYIIKRGTCICGNPIGKDSTELACLLEQRNYLPPADIGSLLGEFERTAGRWKNRTEETYTELMEEAWHVEESLSAYEETCNELVKLEMQMDKHIDFAEKKKLRSSYQNEMQRLSISRGTIQGEIESLKNQRNRIEGEMKSQEAKNEENARWRRRMELAEKLYEKLHRDFSQQERKIFQELNQQIQYNFNRMFNAKDKKIELTEQYQIQMLYKTDVGYQEEKNLSEGEKIARNFAFIVTIMEYSRQQKAKKQEREASESDTLPIVLDGPFSKLGDENIGLIARVLPEVSEQVIIFMLKKDWNYTKLDEYVGAAYEIEKEPDKSYASVKRMEET